MQGEGVWALPVCGLATRLSPGASPRTLRHETWANECMFCPHGWQGGRVLEGGGEGAGGVME
jgi:hypothetical protein